jgi:beta-glucosidase
MDDITKIGTGGGYGGHRVVPNHAAAVAAAMRAGVDMELVGKWNRLLTKEISEGRFDQAILDRAVTRVLRAKLTLIGLGASAASTGNDATWQAIQGYRGDDDVWAKHIAAGEFDTPEGARRPDWQRIVADPAHDALALEAARKAIVLLKNAGGLLPLDPQRHRRVLISR